MAQFVRYFENDVQYTEGPFVYSSIGRIEVELKGHHCPVLMDVSIYNLLEFEREDYRIGAKKSFEQLTPIIDWLNEQVKIGRIVLQGKFWICPKYKETHYVVPRV